MVFPESTTSVEPEQDDKAFKSMYLNLGPQHPATHGTLRLRAEIDGETVLNIDPEMGYLHTGFEKLAEYRSYNQFVVVTDRMNYLSPLSNNIGFAIACEELFDIEVPKRGQYLRVIMAELSRIGDHIISVGLQAMDLGAFSIMLWTFIERERLYDIFEATTGARLTTSWTRVGGIMSDVPDDFSAIVTKFIDKIEPLINEIEYMLSRNKIFMDRTIGVAELPKEKALSLSVTGPILRASGVPYDVRKDRPYLVYPELDFDVPVRTKGDVYARYEVRLEELRQSVRIIRQALKQLPDGPVSSLDHKVKLPPKNMVYNDMESLIHHFKITMPGHGIKPPVGELYSCTEAPNGELGFYIVSDGSGIPYRVRVRPPSLFHFASIPHQVKGQMISDVVACMSSLNIIAGELDR